jgi:hypothetical protein
MFCQFLFFAVYGSDTLHIYSKKFFAFYGGFIKYNVRDLDFNKKIIGDAVPVSDSYDWLMGLDYNLKVRKNIFLVMGLGYYQSNRKYKIIGNGGYYWVFIDTIYKNSQNEMIVEQNYSSVTLKEKVKCSFLNVGVKKFVVIKNSWGLFFSINHRLTFEVFSNRITTDRTWKTRKFYDSNFNEIRMEEYVIPPKEQNFESSNRKEFLVISERYTFFNFQGGFYIQPFRNIRCMITPDVNFYYLDNAFRFGFSASIGYVINNK